MSHQQYEYQIIYEGGPPPPDDYRFAGQPVSAETHIVDARRAGEMFRDMRQTYPPEGGAIELQRRAVGPWETVERAELAPRPVEALAKGDVVRLKAAGPMTVEAVEGDAVRCIWFEGSTLHRATIAAAQLERSRPTPGCPPPDADPPG